MKSRGGGRTGVIERGGRNKLVPEAQTGVGPDYCRWTSAIGKVDNVQDDGSLWDILG